MATCKTWQEVQSDMMKILADAKAGKLSSKTKQYSCGDGLYICVNNNTGKAVWRARIYGVKGACNLGEFSFKNNRMTLATAREKTKALRANRQQEKEQTLSCPTVWRYFEDTYKDYKQAQLKSKSRKRDLVLVFSRYLKQLHSVPLNEVDCGCVTKAVDQLVDLSAGRKNYVINNLCQFMDFAKWKGVINNNPLTGLTKLYQPPAKKHRTSVDPDEYVSKVLEPFKTAPIFFRAVVLLMTFTTLRIGEVVNMRWSYIDGKTKILVIPPDAEGANKHGRAGGRGNETRKQFTPHVVELLQYLAFSAPFESDYICQSPKQKETVPITERAVRLQWNKRINSKGKVADMHGVRNTAYTCLRNHGYDWEISNLALTHEIKKTSNDQAYDGRKLDEKTREALTSWENFIYDQLPKEYLEILEIGRQHPLEWK